MPSNTKNEKSPSTENANTHETKLGGLFSTHTLLWVGALLLILNVLLFATNIRPNTWLFYLNIQHWSVYISVALWITVLWLVSEAIESFEDYLPYIRMLAVTGFAVAIIFWLWSVFDAQRLNTSSSWYSIWYAVATIIAVFCAVRSFFLLYTYKYEGEEYIDMEETTWFWGMSGFLFAVVFIIGLMHMITIRTSYPGTDAIFAESLLASCLLGFWKLYRFGEGSWALLAFGLLILIASIAFVYVAGKWALIFLSRMREW